jgi:hypothetical protein
MKFKDLTIGAAFTFAPSKDGFFKDSNVYVKTSARRYRMPARLTVYIIGSVGAKVKPVLTAHQ